MRSGTELMSSTASAADISSSSSTGQTLHTQRDAAGSSCMRLMRGRAGSARGLLRALRRADPARAPAGPRSDPGRGALLSYGGGPGGRLHLDLLDSEIELDGARGAPFGSPRPNQIRA